MAGFEYVAVDARGKEKKGSIEGKDQAQAKAALKAEGLIPLSVKEQSILTKDMNFQIGSGVKPRDLSIFCRQFNSILTAGVTVISALSMLGEQTDNKSLKKAIQEVQQSVEKGETLASAMQLQEKIFPPMLIHMVEAGEASGSLEVAFDRMGTHFEKDAKLKGMVKKAMIYPIAVCVVAVGVVIIMLTFVIPQFTTMFESIDTELPAITTMVVNLSDFLRSRGYIVIAAAAVIALGIRSFKKTETGTMFFAKMGLKLPLFGVLTTKTAAARLSRTLSTLLAAGLSLISSVDIVAKTMSNEIIKRCLMDAKEEVARGIPLSQPLEQSGLFPPMVYHMARIGEETGNMEQMLDKIADYYEEEVETATAALTAAMEPLVIVVLALVVGVIIMAVMSPMFTLYNSIG